ncbi:MAG: NAD(P)/FAD-dependent oxidoreductase [Bacteroidales bacterium]|nr:NAD(P)/FAD-dependent oxidoreductase [Bacteroidales bacterium]
MLELRNNFIFAPVKLGYTTGNGKVNDKHIDFYNQRSKHVGAVDFEPLYIHKGLREIPTQLGIDNDDKIDGLKKLNDLVHQNGAKTIAHLNHPGRMANPKIPDNFWWSSTDKACENGGAKPQKMDKAMMNQAKHLLVDAALRAEKSGFDFVEIQMGHGYLMAQFLSPAVNDREDEYGGSFENRTKYPLEVIKAVLDAINIPVIARISGDEMMPAGFHIDEMQQFAQLLEKIGVAALHVVAGSVCANPPWFFQHMFVPKGKTWELAGKIKEEVRIPVIFLGKINSGKDINIIKEKFGGEYFALGRALVADPDFVGKYLGSVKGNIRPCLACAEGCLGGVKQGKGLGCMVNPRVNTGLAAIEKTNETKKYAIVGGGLAGMQAAISLTDKGYKIDLFEKNELGGQFNLAWLPPQKESLKNLIDYYLAEVKDKNINVIKKDVKEEDLKDKNYNGIIMATGAVPAVPPIKGLKEYYWTEFLNDDQLPKNQKVAVVGGGLIGLEVASKLIDGGNQVIIIEMLDEIARGMEMIEKAMTVKKLKEKGTKILLNSKLSEVNGNTLIIEQEGKKQSIENVEKIVIATGMKSYIPFEINQQPVYIIGDAKKVGKATEAIRDAYELALSL